MIRWQEMMMQWLGTNIWVWWPPSPKDPIVSWLKIKTAGWQISMKSGSDNGDDNGVSCIDNVMIHRIMRVLRIISDTSRLMGCPMPVAEALIVDLWARVAGQPKSSTLKLVCAKMISQVNFKIWRFKLYLSFLQQFLQANSPTGPQFQVSPEKWFTITRLLKKHFAVLRFRVRTKSCFHLYFLVLFATTTNSWNSLNFWWTNMFEKGLKFRTTFVEVI